MKELRRLPPRHTDRQTDRGRQAERQMDREGGDQVQRKADGMEGRARCRQTKKHTTMIRQPKFTFTSIITPFCSVSPLRSDPSKG
jgi:hypothetical protein